MTRIEDALEKMVEVLRVNSFSEIHPQVEALARWSLSVSSRYQWDLDYPRALEEVMHKVLPPEQRDQARRQELSPEELAELQHKSIGIMYSALHQAMLADRGALKFVDTVQADLAAQMVVSELHAEVRRAVSHLSPRTFPSVTMLPITPVAWHESTQQTAAMPICAWLEKLAPGYGEVATRPFYHRRVSRVSQLTAAFGVRGGVLRRHRVSAVRAELIADGVPEKAVKVIEKALFRNEYALPENIVLADFRGLHRKNIGFRVATSAETDARQSCPIITELVHGSVADRSGLANGMAVVAVDSIPVENVSPKEFFAKIEGRMVLLEIAPDSAAVQPRQRRALNPVLAAILHGTIDPDSPLCLLRGSPMLYHIWYQVVDFNASQLSFSPTAMAILPHTPAWPEPSGIYVNMMPFRICDEHYAFNPKMVRRAIDSLPRELHQWWPVIEACLKTQTNLGGYYKPKHWVNGQLPESTSTTGDDVKPGRPSPIAYLTIDEREVVGGTSHRRGGLHCDSPGTRPTASTAHVDELEYGMPCEDAHFAESRKLPPKFHPWGIGIATGPSSFNGGIYLGSSVPFSSAVYGARVLRPEELLAAGGTAEPTAIGELGNCEHLRDLVSHTEERPEACKLVWMTDTTLHESIPLEQTTRRQFFRLVMPGISVWFAEHSTPNPLGVMPPADVQIIFSSKFGTDSPRPLDSHGEASST